MVGLIDSYLLIGFSITFLNWTHFTYSPKVIKMCAAEEVVVIALPPNTTHLLQPFDKGVFSPLKSQ